MDLKLLAWPKTVRGFLGTTSSDCYVSMAVTGIRSEGNLIWNWKW